MPTKNQELQRFNVDTQGMRQLHADRKPEELIKELVQNAFDEEVTSCRIIVQHQPQHPAPAVLVTVEDDGPGFFNISDAYTMMGETNKRSDPEKRGRFNLGDKEVLAVATWGRIETVGWTVEFPQEGGRIIRKNLRKTGTKVSVLMPWDQEQMERLANRLKLIRPPENIHYKVNGVTVTRQPELCSHEATFPTIIQSAPGEPMRPTRRKTVIHIMAPRQETGWIYEMGIPIQPIELPFDVDVMQKVPMPPNRDTVAESYLKDMYAEVLNAIHQDLPGEQFADTWVRTAVENPRVTSPSVKETIKQRYGDNVVTWSSNSNANMKAMDSGYEVIHPRTMSKGEIKNMRELGGLQSANDVFGDDPESEETIVVENQTMTAFADWVRELGKHTGKNIIVQFIHKTKTRMAACCTMNTNNPIMSFNTHHLTDDFFSHRGANQLEIIIHELGHSEMDGEMSHGPKWGDGCARVAANIAVAIARNPTLIDHPPGSETSPKP